MGRPSDYSLELATEICALIADGLSLRQIGAKEGMPDKRTILRWLEAHEEFRPQYARAREAQTEHFADEILEIADDGSNDWMKRERDGRAFIDLNSEHINRSRLRVDSRKWLMSKLAPKKYGDKMLVGGDPENPQKMVITWAKEEARALPAPKDELLPSELNDAARKLMRPAWGTPDE